MQLWLLPLGLSMLEAKSPSVCSLPREPGVGARCRHPALALGLGHMSLFLGSAQTGRPTIARISPIGPTHALAKGRPWFGLSQPWGWSSTVGMLVDVRGPDTGGLTGALVHVLAGLPKATCAPPPGAPPPCSASRFSRLCKAVITHPPIAQTGELWLGDTESCAQGHPGRT